MKLPNGTLRTPWITSAGLRTLRWGPVGPPIRKENKVSVLHIHILELRGKQSLLFIKQCLLAKRCIYILLNVLITTNY